MGGPPFAGVCLLPGHLGKEMDEHFKSDSAASMIASSSFHEYVVASLLSDDMPKLRSLLPQFPLNYGVLMRWTLALYNMEVYFGDMTSPQRTEILLGWTAGVRDIVEGGGVGHQPVLRLLPERVATRDTEIDEQEAALGSIVSFHCRCNRGEAREAEPMSVEELRRVQLYMATDLAETHPHLKVPDFAEVRCFMGQPVDLAPYAESCEPVLRVAASAPIVAQAAKRGLKCILQEDARLFEKLRWVLSNWHRLSDSAPRAAL